MPRLQCALHIPTTSYIHTYISIQRLCLGPGKIWVSRAKSLFSSFMMVYIIFFSVISSPNINFLICASPKVHIKDLNWSTTLCPQLVYIYTLLWLDLFVCLFGPWGGGLIISSFLKLFLQQKLEIQKLLFLLFS